MRSEPVPLSRRSLLQGALALGSLAACVSDREEDALKLEVMKAAGTRTSCSSRAGNYRFVETKNLNAFLMWIERNPSRKAADRCIELKLALELISPKRLHHCPVCHQRRARLFKAVQRSE